MLFSFYMYGISDERSRAIRISYRNMVLGRLWSRAPARDARTFHTPLSALTYQSPDRSWNLLRALVPIAMPPCRGQRCTGIPCGCPAPSPTSCPIPTVHSSVRYSPSIIFYIFRSKFQYVGSKPCSRGDSASTGTMTSRARMARVMATNMVRRSRASSSVRSSSEAPLGMMG